MIRVVLSALVALASLTAYPLDQASAQPQSLTVVSFGGSYSRACEKGYHERFEAETGINLNFEDYNGGLAQIRAQVDVGNVYWDVVDLQIPDLVRGCDEGLLVPIEINDLSPGADGTPAADDFVEGTITECGVTKLFYSTVFAYNDERIGDVKPTTVDDFFDLDKFPGRRSMRRSPWSTLRLPSWPTAYRWRMCMPRWTRRMEFAELFASWTRSRNTSSGGRPALSRLNCWLMARW